MCVLYILNGRIERERESFLLYTPTGVGGALGNEDSSKLVIVGNHQLSLGHWWSSQKKIGEAYLHPSTWQYACWLNIYTQGFLKCTKSCSHFPKKLLANQYRSQQQVIKETRTKRLHNPGTTSHWNPCVSHGFWFLCAFRPYWYVVYETLTCWDCPRDECSIQVHVVISLYE